MGQAVMPLLVLSLVSNLAVLISPLFMMQVLDRVIPSGNMATLALLGGLALAALALQAAVEAMRDLSLGRMARWSESNGVGLALEAPCAEQNRIIGQVTVFSGFLGGPAALAALGAPWIPVFIWVLWLLHPAFVVLLVGMTFLILTLRAVTQMLGHSAQQNAAACAVEETAVLCAASEAEARQGMKEIAHNLRLKFSHLQRARHEFTDQGETLSSASSAVSTLNRSAGQIAALGLGAWLVSANLMSAGGMIAGSIVMSKAFQAIESLIIQFPHLKQAKSDFLALAAQPSGEKTPEVTHAKPNGTMVVEELIYPRGGGALPRLDRASFKLKPGECMAIVGNSGAGKSTLLRAISGIDPAPIGAVFLDEHEIRGLTDSALARMVGYLPQRAVFETGTIGENISNFEANPDAEAITAAAQAAGVYGLICALPDSFQTDIGRQPYALSAGQMQRVALARAIYADPAYLFLDEPNALLDSEGERALGQALMRLKATGMTIVMVVHRSGILGLADKVLHLESGRVSDFGPKAEILGRLGMGGHQINLPALETSQADLQDWISSQFTRQGDEPFQYETLIIACELHKLACANRPQDALLFAKYCFRFLSETRCELTMEQPMSSKVSERADLSTTKTDIKPDNLVQLRQDEVHLTKLAQMNSEIKVTHTEDQTTYVIAIERDRAGPATKHQRGSV